MSSSSEAIDPVSVFAALGDATRLELVARLGDGGQHNIAQLADGFALSRQGVTKHLRVLQDAGVVACKRVGRESRFVLQPDRLAEAGEYLSRASAQWDEAIERLKNSVEA